MGTKNLNENGPNPFFFGTKNMVRVNLMAMVLCSMRERYKNEFIEWK